jgi:inhibitor of vertebrate lysozyme family protein
MTRTARILSALALALAVAAPTAAKSAQTSQASQQISQKDANTYLFDLLKKPAYRKVWRSQIVPHTPKSDRYWITGGDGPTAPEGAVTVDGKRYIATTMCQPHNCISNGIYILLNKQRAVVLHVERDAIEGIRATRYYGKPTEAEKAALQKLAADKEEK